MYLFTVKHQCMRKIQYEENHAQTRFFKKIENKINN